MFSWILNTRIILIFFIPFTLGGISILSFQPFNLTFLNFFILPSLFLIFSYVRKKSVSTYRKRPFLINFFIIGYSFGVSFFLFGNYWISNSLTIDENLKFLIPIAIILIPLFLGLFYGVAGLLIGPYIKNNFNSLLFFCSIISLFDYFRGKALTGFPWNLWAYSWSWFTEVLQILNFLGLYAYNFFVIFLFSIPAALFFSNKSRILTLSLGLVLFLFAYLQGSFEINENQKTLKDFDLKSRMNVKIISPSLPLNYNLDDDQIIDLTKKLVRYSNPKKDQETIFVWPEGVFGGKFFEEIEFIKKVIKENFSKKHLIVFGVNTVDKKLDKIFNSFVVVNNEFEIVYKYDKIKLVPFGEFLPFEKFFSSFGLKKITFGYKSFSKGANKKNMVFNDWNIKPSICYEIIFTELFQKSNLKNSFIINISEDVWFGNSIGPSQHYAKSILRAVETDSFVVRSANKGISSFINNKGEPIKIMKENEIGSIELDVPKIKNNNQNKNDLIFFVLLITSIFIFIFFKKNEKR